MNQSFADSILKPHVAKHNKSYTAFLKSKVKMAPQLGVEIQIGACNEKLKDHQKSIVEWMVQGGRRACFAAFGLGKSVIQLETVRMVLEAKSGRGLIVIPLGVRQEFRRDAVELLGWEHPPTFVRRIEECGETGIYMTNYETIRDGKLDPCSFTVASLDEASVLRGFGGSKKEMHLCPMQFDLADRVIEQMSNPGEKVLDPFGGLMTVPYRAVKKGRHGIGFELSPSYFCDGAAYCKMAAEEMATPTLFDMAAVKNPVTV